MMMRMWVSFIIVMMVAITSSSCSRSSSSSSSCTFAMAQNRDYSPPPPLHASSSSIRRGINHGGHHRHHHHHHHQRRQLIAGGTPAQGDEFPFFVSAASSSTSGSMMCGGVWIAPSVVLTAAHCAPAYTTGTQVTIGSNVGTRRRRRRRIVTQQIPHAQFDNVTLAYDFMLVQLLEDDDNDNNDTSSFPAITWNTDPDLPRPFPYDFDDGRTNDIDNTDTDKKNYDILQVMGHGAYYPGNAAPTSATLLHTQLVVYRNEDCQVLLPPGFVSHPHVMMCAGWPHRSTGACLGDSGGPLIIMETNKSNKNDYTATTNNDDKSNASAVDGDGGVVTVVGIVSFSKTTWNGQVVCGDDASPTVYARVSAVADWIEQGVACLSLQPNDKDTNNDRRQAMMQNCTNYLLEWSQPPKGTDKTDKIKGGMIAFLVIVLSVLAIATVLGAFVLWKHVWNKEKPDESSMGKNNTEKMRQDSREECASEVSLGTATLNTKPKQQPTRKNPKKEQRSSSKVSEDKGTHPSHRVSNSSGKKDSCEARPQEASPLSGQSASHPLPRKHRRKTPSAAPVSQEPRPTPDQTHSSIIERNTENHFNEKQNSSTISKHRSTSRSRDHCRRKESHKTHSRKSAERTELMLREKSSVSESVP